MILFLFLFFLVVHTIAAANRILGKLLSITFKFQSTLLDKRPFFSKLERTS